jgi:hypothetical protein
MKIYKSIGKIQRSSVIKKEKDNPYFKSKYADINNILELLFPLLEKEGLTISQPLTNMDGKPALKTIIASDSEVLESTVPLPELQEAQKMGSAITYYRRYALVSVFGLATEEDDDGNKASGKETKATIPTIEL